MNSFGKFGGAALLALVLAGPVQADPPHRHPHHHPHSSVRLGIYLGDPWLYPYSYPYPYWARVYVPPVVVTPPPPPVYIEQVPLPVQVLEPGYWYYCNESRAYYPNVKECAGPWQKVAPQPPR